jgi:hypothetical protein
MRLSLLVPLLAGAALVTAPARSAIFASDVEASGSGPTYTLHYLLNEAAVSGSIVVASAAAPDATVATVPLAGDDLSQGPHDKTFQPSGLAAGDYIFKVSVTAAAHTGYDIIVPVTDIPNASAISYGLKSNKAIHSASYGHIFAADYTGHLVHEMNAAGTFVQDIPVAATGSFTPVGIAFDVVGDYYITDQNIDHIDQFHATGSRLSPTWTQVADFTGPITDVDTNDGSFTGRGLQLFGDGADATAYIAAYTPVPNPVIRARLGDTANAPEVLFTGAAIAGTRIDQIVVTPDQKTIYVSSGAAGTTALPSHLNKFVLVPGTEGGPDTWQLDPNFIQNGPDATMTGLCRGLAFSADGKYLWATQSLSGGGPEANYIAKISLVPANPGGAVAAQVLRIAGGLEAAPADVSALDTNSDGSITVGDAVKSLGQSGPTGAIVEKIPAPTPASAFGTALPFTLDTDPKGNLVVGVDSDNTASAIVGTSFYVMALPDSGSTDTEQSVPFTLH